MSFFDLAERDIDKANDTFKPGGPGQYQSVSESRQLRPAYAPFGSLVAKRPKQTKSQSLGPGQYDINR